MDGGNKIDRKMKHTYGVVIASSGSMCNFRLSASGTNCVIGIRICIMSYKYKSAAFSKFWKAISFWSRSILNMSLRGLDCSSVNSWPEHFNHVDGSPFHRIFVIMMCCGVWTPLDIGFTKLNVHASAVFMKCDWSHLEVHQCDLQTVKEATC